jgi:hypothetical protein
MLLVGAAAHTAGSFSLSGETELATSAASAMDAPDAAGEIRKLSGKIKFKSNSR